MAQFRSRRLAPGDYAPNVTLKRPDGEPVALSSLWADRPAVLVFLRHFG